MRDEVPFHPASRVPFSYQSFLVVNLGYAEYITGALHIFEHPAASTDADAVIPGSLPSTTWCRTSWTLNPPQVRRGQIISDDVALRPARLAEVTSVLTLAFKKCAKRPKRLGRSEPHT